MQIPQESLHLAHELAYADFPSDAPDDEALLSLSYVTAPMASPCGRPAALRRSMSPINSSSRGSNRSNSAQRKGINLPRLAGVKRGVPISEDKDQNSHKRMKPLIGIKKSSGGGPVPMSP